LEMNTYREYAFRFTEEKNYGLETYTCPQPKI
jgi:hypothetical protein